MTVDPASIFTAALGPIGLTVVLLLAVALLLRGQYIAPKYLLDKEMERNEALETENVKLNNNVIQLSSSNARMEEALSNMGSEVERLRREVENLQKRLGAHEQN